MASKVHVCIILIIDGRHFHLRDTSRANKLSFLFSSLPSIHTCGGSQWAQVSHLALAEKGVSENEYDVKDVDLCKT